MSDSKREFTCIFNWNGEIHKFTATAVDEQGAFRSCCAVIAKKLGLATSNNVRHYFYDTDKYSIKEVKKHEQAETLQGNTCSR